jgi:hypothetical protein
MSGNGTKRTKRELCNLSAFGVKADYQTAFDVVLGQSVVISAASSWRMRSHIGDLHFPLAEDWLKIGGRCATLIQESIWSISIVAYPFDCHARCLRRVNTLPCLNEFDVAVQRIVF